MAKIANFKEMWLIITLRNNTCITLHSKIPRQNTIICGGKNNKKGDSFGMELGTHHDSISNYQTSLFLGQYNVYQMNTPEIKSPLYEELEASHQ